MCRITISHTIRHHISSESLLKRLHIEPLDTYYHRRILRWAGHVSRMPMSRAPRKLLTSWVANSRPIGCPQMTWGRTLKRHFSVTAFHLSSRNGATLPQIEMNDVLFAGLLRVARRIKRSLITPVRPSGPSFEAAHNNDSHRQQNLDHLSYKNHTARKTGGSTSGQF